MHQTTHPELPTQTFFKLFTNIIIGVTKKFSKVKKIPIYSSSIKSMLGIYLLLSYEVIGFIPEVLRCKPGALVKGFIATPSFSKTT